MTIAGYQTGPIACDAAFIADFDVDGTIPMAGVVSQMDSDRRTMAARAGMRSKYLPLRFDPATGARQIGARYLFDSWSDVEDYMRFTAEELEFEPGVKFWRRPFFSNIYKTAWHVVGAHDFMPLEAHYASRLERFGCRTEATAQELEAAWPALRDAACEGGLAALWLLVRPDRQEVALLTVAARTAGEGEARSAAQSLLSLERTPSLARLLPERMSASTLFDRSSLNLAIWLPRSDALGGEACLFPTYPVHPLPGMPT